MITNNKLKKLIINLINLKILDAFNQYRALKYKVHNITKHIKRELLYHTIFIVIFSILNIIRFG